MVRFRQRQHAGVQLSEDDAKTVDRVHLWTEHRDLVDVLYQTLIRVFTIDVIEEALQLLRARLSRRNQRRRAHGSGESGTKGFCQSHAGESIVG